MQQLSTSRYVSRASLGEGGMGLVTLVYDTVEGREVALKQILATGAGVAEFKQEFWWMTRLRHPGLVEVYDFGTDDLGRPYFTMEVVGGVGLDAVGPLPPEHVADILRQLGRALRPIHHAGLVHGDIKPANIRLLPDGAIKLMDFGLMARAGQATAVRGTLSYMAPELIQAARIDQRADLYAVGALAYELLTGRPPFEEESTAALLRAHLDQPPLPPGRFVPALDPALDALVMRLLAKDPLRRPQSAAELLEALGESVSDEAAALLASPFVGRDAELAGFDEALARLAADRAGKQFWVTGAHGAGKSALLDELALHGQLAGIPVFRGRARGLAPYEPFVQILRQAWPALLRLDDQALEVHAPALPALVPDLVAASAAHRLEPQQEKLRLHAALGELFVALAQGDGARSGAILLIDDWHDADPLSRELFTTLERHFVGQPLVVVLASQLDAPDGTDAWKLAPLGRTDLARLLGGMLGVDGVPETFLAQMAELTGGVPAVVETFLGHLVDARLLPQAGGRWVLGPLPAPALSAGTRDILVERLADLSPLARSILELAAVIGEAFGLGLLLKLLPEDAPEALYEAIADLEHAQLMTHREGVYQPTQAHLVEVLRHGLAPDVARDLHTRVAEALEEEPLDLAADGEPLPRTHAQVVRLAHHYLAGALPAKAILYALWAAQRLAGLFANDSARDLLTRGWALASERGAEVPEAVRLDYLMLRGDLARVAGASVEADAAYAEALPVAEALGLKSAIARGLVGLGLVRQVTSQNEAALELFREALPACRELPHVREELRCLAAMGRAYYSLGDISRSQGAYEEALMRARSAGDLAYAGEALGFLGLLHVSAEPVPGAGSRISEGLDCLRQAIHIKEAIGDKLGLNDSYMLLGNAQLTLGDLPGAEHSFLRNQAICREIGAFEEAFAYLNLSLVASERGDHMAALGRIQKSIELAEPRGNQFALGLAACLEARSLLNLGVLARPVPMIVASLEAARAADDVYWELFALVYLIEALLALGRWDMAEGALLEALNAQAESGVTEFNLVLPFYQATLAMRRGHTEPAESTFRDALAKAEAREAQLWESHICLGLGELALQTGGLHEANRWVSRAQDRAGVADALAVIAEGHFLRGRIAVAGGDFIEADSHFQRAQESATQLSLHDLTARVWYERGVLQYPSPAAVQLLKRAQEAMTQQLEGLAEPEVEAFLGARGRRAIAQAQLPGEGLGRRPGVGKLEGGGPQDEHRDTIAQQRVWLDELQHACGLLLKQLDFSQAIARSSEASHVMTQALALLLEVSQGERGELFLLEGGRLVSKARKQLSGQPAIEEDWTHYIDFLNEAVRSGEMVYVPDTEDLPMPPRLAGARSVMVLPILDEKERMGAMLVLGQPNGEGRLLKRELEALRVLAGQLGTALRNLRMQAEWKEKTQRLEMLYQLSASITSTLVMDEVLDLVVKLSLEITHAERGFLLLADEAGELECQAARHSLGQIPLAGPHEAYSKSICRRVLETGEAVCVEDTQDDHVLRHQKSIQDLNLRTVMCVPLRVAQKSLGVLYVDSRLVVKSFTGRDLELMKSIASHASIALENARLYNLATVDSLTQLYFRSHFDQRMREELMRASRYAGPMSVLMMDIDHFKRFNDNYGHAVGDEVLRHVAAVVRDGVRQDVDIPARYGGEEMVVLLPETDSDGARLFAERIRKAVDETFLDVEEHRGLHVTISVGVATYPTDALNPLALMERADRALYASKRGGRNLVTVYSPELE